MNRGNRLIWAFIVLVVWTAPLIAVIALKDPEIGVIWIVSALVTIVTGAMLRE